MNGPRHLVVYNPAAGMGRAAGLLGKAKALLTRRGIDHEVRLTTGAWHAAELARDARREGFEVVVAAGGDGTVNEVLNGLMLARERGETVPAMGVLGIGRGNDFGYAAALPVGLEAGVEALAGGERKLIDIGRVSGGDYPRGRYFGNGIGIGFDTIVGLEAAGMRRVHGFMGYVLGAAKTFIKYPAAPALRVAHDRGAIEQRSHQVSIMNGRRMGGAFFMAPRAEMGDGLLDLCMAGVLSRRDMLALMLAYTKGSQASNPKIRTERSARYEITAPEGGLVVHADGETICRNGGSLVVECLPGMVPVVFDPALA